MTFRVVLNSNAGTLWGERVSVQGRDSEAADTLVELLSVAANGWWGMVDEHGKVTAVVNPTDVSYVDETPKPPEPAPPTHFGSAS